MGLKIYGEPQEQQVFLRLVPRDGKIELRFVDGVGRALPNGLVAVVSENGLARAYDLGDYGINTFGGRNRIRLRPSVIQ